MDFEVKMKDAENRELDLERVDASQADPDTDYVDKEGEEKLEEDIEPKLIREAKKIKVLRITKRKSNYYNLRVLRIYLKYFTHVVFIDDSNRKDVLSGFAEADKILGIIKSDDEKAQNFINSIREWTLSSDSIIKDVFVMKGASRKQVLDTMKLHARSVLPVVSMDRRYEGVVEYDSIIWQITKDFYGYTKNS